MNEFSWMILPVVLQVTLLAGFLYLICLAGIRINASKTARLISLGTVMMLVFCVTIVLPLPSWFQSIVVSTAQSGAANFESVTINSKNSDMQARQNSASGMDETGEKVANVEEESNAMLYWKSFVNQQLKFASRPDTDSAGISWLSWFSFLLVALSSFGISRLSIAIVRLQRVKRSLIAIDSPDLHLLLIKLTRELGIKREVAVCHSRRVDSAATFGWRHPVILLSSDYLTWDRNQLRSVLAHELAHIAHNDFLSVFVSQVCAAVHFYNPLVHSLITRMRMAQEIAADNVAVELTKDREMYLRVLAGMALDQDDNKKVALLPLFLPNDQTFIRRIQMLRTQKTESKNFNLATSTRIGLPSLLLTGIVLSAATVIAGIRVPTPPIEPGVPTDGIAATLDLQHESNDGARLDNAVSNSEMVTSTDPTNIALEPMANEKSAGNAGSNIFTSLARTLSRDFRKADDRWKSANKIRQLVIALHNYHDAHGKFPTAVMKHKSGKTFSWRVAILPYIEEKKIFEDYRFNEDWDSEHNLRVTASMPAEFRHPSDKRRTNSAYFAVIGQGAPLAGKVGITLDDIVAADGLPNTIMLIEAKRDIHWAKPADVSAKEALKLKHGGYSKDGFNAAMSDAAVRFLSDNVSASQLEELLTYNGDKKEVEK